MKQNIYISEIVKIAPRPMVLFLGAGATRGGLEQSVISRRPNAPLDSDFFKIARMIHSNGTATVRSRVLRDLWDLYGREVGLGMEEVFREIEARLTIRNIAPPQNKPYDWSRRYDDLVDLIRRVIIQTTSISEKPSISEIHKVISDALKPNDTVITFNYDLVFEEAVTASGLWSLNGGYGTKVDVRGLRASQWAKKWFSSRGKSPVIKSKVKLLKMHGSLNWENRDGKYIQLLKRPYFIKAGRTLKKIEILPPVWKKQIDRDPYKQIWKEARGSLEACKSLVIAGYSMPDADLLAKTLLREVIRHRASGGGAKKLRCLVLVDPSESVRNKYYELFLPILSDRSDVHQLHALG